MPTLLEKNPTASTRAVEPSEMVHQRHRWERWRGVVLASFIGLATTLLALWMIHPSWHTPANGKIIAGIWIGGFLLTTLAAFIAWRFAPASPLETARQMDRDLASKNRLETAATLHGSNSLLAQAQREETVSSLGRETKLSGSVHIFLPWLAGGVLFLLLAHLVTLAVWIIPPFLLPTTSVAPPLPPAVNGLPKATIVWKSPEAETKANPIEEVPTVAVVQSASGLKNLSLEISVNGAPKKSILLPPTPYDKAGTNPLKASLYLDDLGVEPFDVVSYFIRAQRITDQKVPDTTSAIHFVQIRPFRDDVTQARGGSGLNERNHDLLIQLKLAELLSVKENFILAHTDLPPTNPLRMKENERVGKNQAELSAKTEEVVNAFIQAGYSADMIDLLRQAESPMDDAAKKILATQNDQALPSQQKALSLIVGVEKFFHKIMADGKSATSNSGPTDPFRDKQQHELKKRMQVAAGQLETLAKNQTKLANDLGHPDAPANNSPANDGTPTPDAESPSPAASGKIVPLPPAQAVDPFGPDADKGTMAERQVRVVQGIESLLNSNTVLPPAAAAALQDAQKHATESMQSLDQANDGDAKEPAANAASDLQRANEEMNKAGEEQTKQAMQAAQQQLNDLARQLHDLAGQGTPDAQQKLADLAQQVADFRKQLEDAADKQLESGSANGAHQLDALAKAIQDQKIEKDLSDMGKAGLDATQAQAIADRMEALAGQAAQGTASAKPSAEDMARLIDSLQASRANLERLAQQAGGAVPHPGQSGGAPGQDPVSKTPGSQGQTGQGQEPGQGQKPGGQKGQGDQGNGQEPGKGQGQNPGGASSGEGQGIDPNGTGRNGVVHGGPGIGDTNPPPPRQFDQAYRDVVANLKDTAQRLQFVDPKASSAKLLQAVNEAEKSKYQTSSVANVVSGYQAIAAPLDQLIVELSAAVVQAQREEVVKQPNLDEAPPAFRSAVSDYFESMSKDYHPDTGAKDAKKP